MGRPITLFTGPWADLPLEDLARKASDFGYQGLELDTSPDHLDIERVLADDGYCAARRDLLERYDLELLAIGARAIGQAVLDHVDARHKSILPARVWGNGAPEGVSDRAAEELKDIARAAQKLGVGVVTGFSGSSIWPLLQGYPAPTPAIVDAGYELFAERFNPILDVFGECGVQLALEVRPGQIAFDLYSARRALDAVDRREELGFTLDPSQLLWQGVDAVEFIRALGEHIYFAHVKDAIVKLDGRAGVLAGHLPTGDTRRGWDYRSPGRGGVSFEEIVRALNEIRYAGPLSVDWADPGMDREAGAREAVEFVKGLNFTPAGAVFDPALAAG